MKISCRNQHTGGFHTAHHESEPESKSGYQCLSRQPARKFLEWKRRHSNTLLESRTHRPYPFYSRQAEPEEFPVYKRVFFDGLPLLLRQRGDIIPNSDMRDTIKEDSGFCI